MNAARDQSMAASIGNVDWLQLCMKTADSQVKADGYGFTTLHMAALHSRLQCLKLLLEDYGMDVNVPSVYGWRALHLVMNRKSGQRAMPCLRYLLQRGADVNVKSQNLTTPLHRAASEGLEDCIAVLVEAGADVHARDSEGNKPIDLCHLWCRRSSARFLRSAMWKKDKEDDARELKTLVEIRRKIEKLDKNIFLQMTIPSNDSTETKKTSMKRETFPRSGAAHHGADSRYCRGGKAKQMKTRFTGKESNKNAIVPKGRGKQVSEGRKSTSKNSSWNPSTNPHKPPTLYINRSPTLWQGIYQEDVTKKDISSKVLLTKDEQGQLQIQTLQHQVFSPPNLPYEVIERCLFPKRGPQDRIQIPKDFKATHVFDVPRKQQPPESQKPVSEISLHLRRNLDSKFRKSPKEPAPLKAVPL
ncbi:ankyrin repeat domain-containing protein 53 [Bufo gargarizans]|uniref:ankyrin repeat domain-containing protein 53 n=1 Tax=Bufo gargarizans TaxID=30331 RepID=UPI001CF5B04A|nr:ankyrin repeat domain-containing protein 53 [Bufo gargarizans]XP_044159150.1 ankyrin repeat domain-containing protein 53 [Bufo gargarizans]